MGTSVSKRALEVFAIPDVQDGVFGVRNNGTLSGVGGDSYFTRDELCTMMLVCRAWAQTLVRYSFRSIRNYSYQDKMYRTPAPFPSPQKLIDINNTLTKYGHWIRILETSTAQVLPWVVNSGKVIRLESLKLIADVVADPKLIEKLVALNPGLKSFAYSDAVYRPIETPQGALQFSDFGRAFETTLQLKSLDLYNVVLNDFTLRDLITLGTLPNLTNLKIAHCEYTPGFMKGMSNNNQFEHLNLKSIWWTRNFLKDERFSIRDKNRNSLDLQELLKSCPNLQVVDLAGCRGLVVADLPSIIQTRLRHLSALYIDFEDTEADHLDLIPVLLACPPLKTLNFLEVPLGTGLIQTLLQAQHFSTLVEVTLGPKSGSELDSPSLQIVFANSPNLEMFYGNFLNMQLWAKDMKALDWVCFRLEQLYINFGTYATMTGLETGNVHDGDENDSLTMNQKMSRMGYESEIIFNQLAMLPRLKILDLCIHRLEVVETHYFHGYWTRTVKAWKELRNCSLLTTIRVQWNVASTTKMLLEKWTAEELPKASLEIMHLYDWDQGTDEFL